MNPAGCSHQLDPRLVGDPVDTLTGAVVDRVLDFRLTGPIELRWYRHYDSAHHRQRMAFGPGHTHEFDRQLVAQEDALVLHEPVGRQIVFPRLAQDGDAVARGGATLQRLTLRRYLLTRPGEPAMAFEFHAPHARARLAALLRDGQAVRFEHDAELRLHRIVDSLGRAIAVDEDENGMLHRLEWQRGPGDVVPLMQYHYDARGNLAATENGHGKGHAFAWDEADRLVQRRGRKGFRFHFNYDAQGRCTLASGDDRIHGVALSYEVPGRRVKVTRPDGGEWTYLFDAAGLLQSVRDPLGGQRRFVRDELGRTVLDIDPNGNATRQLYDDDGALVAQLTPQNRRLELPREPSAPDPMAHRVAGNAAEYEFGRLLDVERIVLPAPQDIARLPWPEDLRAQVAPLRRAPAGAAHAFDVRPLGVLWWPDPAAGRIFNDLGKLVSQVDDDGRQRRWSYDESGNVETFVDFDGSTWHYDHGRWHFQLSETNPLGDQVRYAYTTSGEIARFEDAGGTVSEYRYDAKDHLIEVRRHGVLRDRYERDTAGNLIGKHAADGRRLLQIEIGPGNLPVKRTLACGEVQHIEYDVYGRAVGAESPSGHLAFAYDDLGNRTLETRDGLGVAMRFQGWRRPASCTWFGRFAAKYEWTLGSALTVTDPAGGRHRIDLLAPGLVERSFSNGSREAVQYDNAGRCRFKHMRSGNGHNRLWNRRYVWSGEGELREVDDSLRGRVEYVYDAAHRLRGRATALRSDRYELDAADNLVAITGEGRIEFDAGNRLRAAGGAVFGHDDRNHLSLRTDDTGTTRYLYDSRDQLVRCETPQGLWQARYDPFGRRTSKTWLGRTTTFYWNDDQLVAECAPDGQLRLYIYADPLAQTPLVFLDYDSIDAPPESGRRYIVHSDQLGAPILVEDDAGATAWSAEIEPFGHARIAAGSRIVLNLRLPGQYWDEELNLSYNRFRHYDPKLGRYLQSDPWGIPGGNNLYAYRTNPLHVADVRGLGEEEKKQGKPCPDEEGTKATGKALAEKAGMPPAPEGYHYAEVGGQPVLKSNPGSGNPTMMFNPNTGKFEEAPANSQYRRASHSDDDRQKVLDGARGEDGVARCPCGKPVESADAADMQMGHKPENKFSTERNQAIADGVPPKEFNQGQKDLSKYRPEHPGCNMSHEYE
jgi:RHS repeat-associated protein